MFKVPKFAKNIFRNYAQSIFGIAIYRAIQFARTIFFSALSLSKSKSIFPNAENLLMDYSVEIKYPENITLGKSVVIGANCTLGALANITFGDYVRVSKGVSIETATLNLHGDPPYKHKAKPIHIGRGVWLGTNCIVLGGVTIGEGAVIGAGTIVSRDVEPNTILVSAQTRIIRKG